MIILILQGSAERIKGLGRCRSGKTHRKDEDTTANTAKQDHTTNNAQSDPEPPATPSLRCYRRSIARITRLTGRRCISLL